MARCPFAVWDPLGRQTEPRMVAHNIACVHTMAGTIEGVRALFKRDGYSGVESHFGVAADGTIYQWQDTDFQADANLDGNPEVISVETEDMGEPFPKWSGSNVPKWTTAQENALVRLFAWICLTHKIPAALIPDTKPGRRGLAYHRQGIDGNYTTYAGRVSGGVRWSSSGGKACPGDRRIKQFVEGIAPRVAIRVAPDFDFVVVATKGDRKVRKRFENAGRNFATFVKERIAKGWAIAARRVKDR